MTSTFHLPPSALIEAPELPLGLPAGADVTLRDIYNETVLAREGITFERVLATPSTRLCLERAAQAAARARRGEA